MSELDPFEIRLGAAVRSLADRAETAVDAMVVAERAMKPDRIGGAVRWLGRSVSVPVSVLLLLGLLTALVAWSLGMGGRVEQGHFVVPTSTLVSPTLAGDAVRSAHVTGTSAFAIVSSGTSTSTGDVTRTRGMVITTIEGSSDPRASGSGTLLLSLDASGPLGFEWGIYRLANDAGAWEGACTGAAWNDGEDSDVSCWLLGSGAYQGLTYNWHGRNTGLQADIEGVIVAAAPPSSPVPSSLP